MKHSSLKHLLLAGIILLATSVCRSEGSIKDQLDSINGLSFEDLLNIEVEVASTEKTNIQKSPSTVTIITKSDLKNYNFLNLPEALETIAGISIYRTYIKRDIVTSRGILQDNYSNKVLVLINKIPAYNPVTGESNLYRVNIEAIERIEVLRGPASVLYGSNAYSGVINIVLKNGSKQETLMHGSGGIDNSRSAGGLFAGSVNNVDLFLVASNNCQDATDVNFMGEDSVSGHVDEYINSTTLLGSLKYKGHSLLLNTYYGEESFLGITPTPSAGAGFPHSQMSKLASYSYRKHWDNSSLIASFTFDFQERQLGRNIENSIRSKIKGYQSSTKIAYLQQINSKLQVELNSSSHFKHALEYRNYYRLTEATADKEAFGLVFDGNNNMLHARSYEHSASGQLLYSGSAVSATAGSRITYNALFGTNISARTTIVKPLNERQSMKLIYGESYRTPSLFELYFEYPTILGNPNLKPETSRSIELAYVFSYPIVSLQCLIYYAEYENKIYRKTHYNYSFKESVLGKVNVYENGEYFNSIGSEIELSYRNPTIANAFLNIDITKGLTKESHEKGNSNFKYTPAAQVSGGVSKKMYAFSASSIVNYFSESNGYLEPIPQQFTLDLALGAEHITWGKKFNHTLYVKNLFDHQRELPEYVRQRTLNSLPNGYGRTIGYRLTLKL